MAKRLSSQTTHWLVLSQSPNQLRDTNFTLVCNFDKFHIFHLIGPYESEYELHLQQTMIKAYPRDPILIQILQ